MSGFMLSVVCVRSDDASFPPMQRRLKVMLMMMLRRWKGSGLS